LSKQKNKNKVTEKVYHVDDIYDAALRARIDAILKLPMNKRTNFLRKRLPNGGSII
jgi:hypothetical protein